MFGYMEQLIWAIFRSSFSKDTFCYILISILAIILRTHIDIILAWCLSTNLEYLNIVIRLGVSSMLVINSKYTYDMVHRYKPELYKYIEYLIDNYNEENFKRWKKYLVVSVCVYFYLASYIIEISNASVRMMIIEFLLCYHIIESYDRYNKTKFKFYQIKEFDYKESITVFEDDSYHSELFDIKKSE